MYFEGIIDTFEKLMDEIMWDWPDSSNPKGSPKIHRYSNPRHTATQGYGMNKTAIFQENGKFWCEYKETQYEVTPEVFAKFEQFYLLLYGDKNG